MKRVSLNCMSNILSAISKKTDRLFSRPEIVFLVLIIPFGILSAVLVPQISVTDENSHFQRAYEIADLNMICRGSVTQPKEIVEKDIDPWQRNFSSDYGDEIDFSEEVSATCRSASGNNPILYLPHVIGIWISKLFSPSAASMILFARIASVIFYAAIVFLLIKKLAIGKWVLVVIALTPQMVHLAASISADPINNLVIFSGIVFMVNLFVQSGKISRNQTLILLMLAVLAALTKANNILLFFPLAFIPYNKFAADIAPLRLRRFYKWAVLGLFGVVFLVVYKLWTSSTGLDASQGFGAIDPYRFLKIIYHTYISGYGDLLVQGAFGQFSSFGYHIFTIDILAILSILGVALFYTSKDDLKISEHTRRTLSITAFTALALYILATTYLFASMALPFMNENMKFANGVQGRYFTASLLLLLPATLYFRKYIKVSFKKASTIGKICFTVIFLELLHYIYLTVDYALKGGYY